jgi:outer membrane lipoprotein SlyB
MTRSAVAALLAAVALLATGCNDSQSGDSFTDNQERIQPPSASPS